MTSFFWSGISVCLCVFMKWCFSPFRKLTWQSQVWLSLLNVKRWSTSPNLSWPSESASCTASTWWVSSHKGKPSDRLQTYQSRLPDVSNSWKKQQLSISLSCVSVHSSKCFSNFSFLVSSGFPSPLYCWFVLPLCAIFFLIDSSSHVLTSLFAASTP